MHICEKKTMHNVLLVIIQLALVHDKGRNIFYQPIYLSTFYLSIFLSTTPNFTEGACDPLDLEPSSRQEKNEK